MTMEITYKQTSSPLVFEIEALHPRLDDEVEKWLKEQEIKYEYNEYSWGPASYHYSAHIEFENEADATPRVLREPWRGTSAVAQSIGDVDCRGSPSREIRKT